MRVTNLTTLLCLAFCALLLAGCGGGGGGGGGGGFNGTLPPSAQLLGTFTASLNGANETTVTDPDATGTFLVNLDDDGGLRFSVTVEAAWVADIIAMHIHRGLSGADGPVVVDLLGGGASFDPATLSAEDDLDIDAALAAEIALSPGDFYVNVHTTAAPGGFVRAQLSEFSEIEVHAILLGSNESTVVDASARGAVALLIGVELDIDFVLAMGTPSISDVTAAHIHFGAAGVDGGIAVSLEIPSAQLDTVAGTRTGTVPIPLDLLSRILQAPSEFYVNAHTIAAPAGIVRGQLGAGPEELWAALRGDRETNVMDPNASGGLSLVFESFTKGRAILAVPPNQGIDNVLNAHVHEGTPGNDGPVVIDLLAGGDYATGANTGSAEGSITLNRTWFARILANPAGFYANFHTAAAPNGLVREQLTRDQMTFFANLSGAEEVPVADPSAEGAMTLVFTSAQACSFGITMIRPVVSSITSAHIHDGPVGVNGSVLIDLLGGTNISISGNTVVGETTFTGRTFARMLAAPELFYCNTHTSLAPAGVARGQTLRLTGDTPPAGVQYNSPVTYLTGTAITPNVPSSIGGAVTSYAVSPALPAGLSLDSGTGIISGTATAASSVKDYTVTATNSAGSSDATVKITVTLAAPAGLSYTSPVTYQTNAAIAPNVPTSTGGPIATYVVSPALPSGLSLNTGSGVISGIPTAVTAAANYTITATNASGSTGFAVTITVSSSLLAPTNLTYSSNPVSYMTGHAISNNSPSSSGGPVAGYTVTPSLPAGLSIHATSGVISGTPTTITAAKNYTVTASNASGSTQASVNIGVVLGTPMSLSYSNTPGIGYVQGGSFATMSPTVKGGAVSSYSISPSLPSGISIHSSTGVISGSPTTTSSQTTYTVTASNTAGSATATVAITIYQ